MFGLDDHEITKIALELVGTLLFLLLSLNAWFVKRAFHKLDGVEKTVTSVIPTQNEKINHIEKSVSEVRQEIGRLAENFKEVSDLKARVSVVEFAMKGISNGKTNSRNTRLV